MSRFSRTALLRTHRLALVEADGVGARHEDEAVPPLPVLLQVLEQVPREDGAVHEGVLPWGRTSDAGGQTQEMIPCPVREDFVIVK